MNTDVRNRLASLSAEQRAALATQLAELKRRKLEAERIVPVKRTASTVPLSFTQQRIWILDQFSPGSRQHNMSGALRMHKAIDPDRLRHCFEEVIRRHEPLRTIFTVIDGEPTGVVVEQPELDLALVDLRSMGPEAGDARAQELMVAEGRRPFDLKVAPLLRIQVIRLEDEQYLIQLTMHHIISDGWSTKVFFQELGALYAADERGLPSPLPALPYQYSDYAQWQRRRYDTAQDLADYWKRQLAGAKPLLDLPADRPRPVVRSLDAETVPVRIERETMMALRELGLRHGSSLFMTVLAAFQVLLGRHAREDDILIGVPVANREQAGTEQLIGAFINTLVLRVDLSGAPSFSALLDQVKQVALDAYGHQALPFEKVLEVLQPERNLSHSPVIQVLVNFQADATATAGVAGSRFIDVRNGTSQFDLVLNLVEKVDAVTGHLEYSTDLFNRETAEQLVRRYLVLLAGIIRDPEQSIHALPLVTDAERKQQLVDWNSTQSAYRSEASIHGLIAEQARRTPDAIAVVFGDEMVTYAEIDRRADRIARAILAQPGVEAQSLIGIFLERSPELIVALLGILKAGCSYVPLDPGYPADRIAFVLADAGVPVVLTQSALAERLPEFGGSVLNVDDNRDSQVSSHPLPEVTPGVRAYTIYTSGSTGRPKGVEITHRAVVNFLESMRKEPGLTAQDILLAVTTISFDIAGLECFLPLAVGARVVIASRSDTLDGQRLAQLIVSHGVTVLQATPATWRLMIDAGWRGSPRLTALCGGEALPPDLARELLPRCARLWNLYGPTETTIWSLLHRVDSVEGPVPIGRPIGNTVVYVLNESFEPVPTGVTGELYIGGVGVALGYHDRPEFTAERFVRDPFSQTSSSRLYRTGDLVRWRKDGVLEFVGRIDTQVKLRGYRIELGEIEAVMGAQPCVKQAVCVVREDSPGNRALVAYVVPLPDGTPGNEAATVRDGLVETLRAALRARVPEYMVPQRFVALDAMPLTPNGKIDRRRLPEPDPGAGIVNVGDRAGPSNEIEAKLVHIWEALLHVAPVGLDDSFFAIGGHSLLATKLILEIRNRMGVDLPLHVLFERQPTIKGMAEIIAHAMVLKSGGVAYEGTLDLASEVSLAPRRTASPSKLQHAETCDIVQGSATNRWFPLWRPSPAAVIRLVCLPHAGGSASVYRAWPRSLPPSIEVCAAQPPGREMRDAEMAFERHADYVASFVEAVHGLMDLPLVLFGHSMGAVMAFEVARMMRTQSLCTPLYLFVSGMRAPHLPRVRWNFHDLPEADLVDYLCKLGGVPAPLLEDAELRRMILPVVRKDFKLMDFYSHKPEAPLDVPIRAYGGERDMLLDEASLDAWREHTSAFKGTRMFPGGHMYLTTSGENLLRDITDCLRPLMSASPRQGSSDHSNFA